MNIPAPMEDMPLTLEQRLVRFDPERHGGEFMAVVDNVGVEALTCPFNRHDDQSSLTSLIPCAVPSTLVVIAAFCATLLLAMNARPAMAAPGDEGSRRISMQAEVPPWLLGEWHRDWIERDGARLNTRAVLYLQAPVHFGDLRIPYDRPSLASAKSFADLDDAALHALLRQQGMVGHARADGMVATWTADIDFQPPDGSVDAGRMERRGARAFLEHALDNAYTESWTKWSIKRERRFLVVRVERGGRLDRMLVVVGNRFIFARNRVTDLPRAESLEALAEAEHANHARLVEYLDCEISSGSVRHGNARWIVEHSTLPWREGVALDFIDALRGADLRRVSGLHAAQGERWSVPVDTFPDRELNELIGDS